MWNMLDRLPDREGSVELLLAIKMGLRNSQNRSQGSINAGPANRTAAATPGDVPNTTATGIPNNPAAGPWHSPS